MIEIIHKTCGKVAFLCNHVPTKGEMMLARDYLMPNGDEPASEDWMVCGTCNKRIKFNQGWPLAVRH